MNTKRKEKPKMKAKTIVLLLMALTIIVVACTPKDNEPDNSEKSFILEVTYEDGSVNSYTVNTTEATVGAALLEEGLIEGTTSSMGLMVSHVNGVRADFVEDGAYWMFVIDGEMAMVGVDSTNIEEGVIYAFVYTPA